MKRLLTLLTFLVAINASALDRIPATMVSVSTNGLYGLRGITNVQDALGIIYKAVGTNGGGRGTNYYYYTTNIINYNITSNSYFSTTNQYTTNYWTTNFYSSTTNQYTTNFWTTNFYSYTTNYYTTNTFVTNNYAGSSNYNYYATNIYTTNNDILVGVYDPAPITDVSNISNIWLFSASATSKKIVFTNRNGSAATGTGVWDLVYWSAASLPNSAGIMAYTGLVDNASGNNGAISVVIPAGYYFGARLTNAVNLTGWRAGLMGIW